jgi:UDP-N-acetylmuramyl pentapeptide phosphotransferase/UDP-N-acetylglucosamine-1-phosphate transferase
LLGLILIVLEKKVFRLGDSNLNATQASHSRPTSRLGGIAILFTSVVFSFFLTGFSGLLLFLALLPLFFMGLLEDIGINNSPIIRLLIGALSAAIGIYFYGAWLSHIDTFGFNWLLSFPTVGVLFTIFAVVGLVNAINLIDGVNGLACAQVMISAFAISIIADKVGEGNISTLGLIIGCATLGLFLLNYPFGYLFLGDAGAYTLGFLLAWMLVLLSHRHPELSDWSLLLLVIWPVSDTLLSVFRRKINSASAGRPDKLHFHQLIMRSWQIKSNGKINRNVANPLATATIIPFTALPAVGGIIFCYNSNISIIIVILTLIFFVVAYFALLLSARSVSKRRSKI